MLCLHPQEMNSLQKSRCMGQSVGHGFPELVSLHQELVELICLHAPDSVFIT